MSKTGASYPATSEIINEETLLVLSGLPALPLLLYAMVNSRPLRSSGVQGKAFFYEAVFRSRRSRARFRE